MGEVVRFVPKSEREQARLVREARAIYDSIFPPVDLASGQKAPMGRTISGARTHRSNGEPLP